MGDAPSPANLTDDPTRLAGLLDAARAQLELQPGEETMWFADTAVPPSANAVNPPAIYLAANAKASAKSTQTVNRLGVCMTVEFDRRGFDPTFDATDYMLEYKKKSVEFGQARDGTRVADTVIKILKEPAHGVLEKPKGKYSDDNYIYTPGPSEDKSGNEFYRGLDHFVMSVSAGGQTVQIHYTVSVVDNFRDEKGNVTSECGNPYWKISQSDFNPGTQDYAAWLRSSELSSLLATASQSFAGFQDLAGSAVGNTTGEGANAAITETPPRQAMAGT